MTLRHRPVACESPQLLLVEGTDVEWLITYAMKSWHIQGWQVIDFGSKDNVANVVKGLVISTGFGKVRRIVVVRDAESDPAAAFEAVRSCLRNQRLEPPSSPWEFPISKNKVRVAIAILPGDRNDQPQPGMVEDLCLWSRGADPLLGATERYLQDAATLGEPVANRSKATLHAYLSAKANFCGLKLGEAAARGAFDFAHECFIPIRRLLALDIGRSKRAP